MWKKDETPTSTPVSPAEPTPRIDRPVTSGASSGGRAIIGPSISIRGEVTGDEDLLIQGRVDGSVDLKQHSVTVGPQGQVKAGITARMVVVEGTVQGNLKADEQVILKSSASVQGDITAPRVVLEDGARFRGGVDMGDPARRDKSSGSSNASQAEKTLSLDASLSADVDKAISGKEGKNPVGTATAVGSAATRR